MTGSVTPSVYAPSEFPGDSQMRNHNIDKVVLSLISQLETFMELGVITPRESLSAVDRLWNRWNGTPRATPIPPSIHSAGFSRSSYGGATMSPPVDRQSVIYSAAEERGLAEYGAQPAFVRSAHLLEQETANRLAGYASTDRGSSMLRNFAADSIADTDSDPRAGGGNRTSGSIKPHAANGEDLIQFDVESRLGESPNRRRADLQPQPPSHAESAEYRHKYTLPQRDEENVLATASSGREGHGLPLPPPPQFKVPMTAEARRNQEWREMSLIPPGRLDAWEWANLTPESAAIYRAYNEGRLPELTDRLPQKEPRPGRPEYWEQNNDEQVLNLNTRPDPMTSPSTASQDSEAIQQREWAAARAKRAAERAAERTTHAFTIPIHPARVALIRAQAAALDMASNSAPTATDGFVNNPRVPVDPMSAMAERASGFSTAPAHTGPVSRQPATPPSIPVDLFSAQPPSGQSVSAHPPIGRPTVATDLQLAEGRRSSTTHDTTPTATPTTARPPSAQICPHWLTKPKFCSKGPCPFGFAHEILPGAPQERLECWFWAAKGSCSKADTCVLEHRKTTHGHVMREPHFYEKQKKKRRQDEARMLAEDGDEFQAMSYGSPDSKYTSWQSTNWRSRDAEGDDSAERPWRSERVERGKAWESGRDNRDRDVEDAASMRDSEWDSRSGRRDNGWVETEQHRRDDWQTDRSRRQEERDSGARRTEDDWPTDRHRKNQEWKGDAQHRTDSWPADRSRREQEWEGDAQHRSDGWPTDRSRREQEWEGDAQHRSDGWPTDRSRRDQEWEGDRKRDDNGWQAERSRGNQGREDAVPAEENIRVRERQWDSDPRPRSLDSKPDHRGGSNDGKDGKDGKDGNDGKDGKDGNDGKDSKDSKDSRDSRDSRDSNYRPSYKSKQDDYVQKAQENVDDYWATEKRDGDSLYWEDAATRKNRERGTNSPQKEPMQGPNDGEERGENVGEGDKPSRMRGSRHNPTNDMLLDG
ncbi:hypothetical protein GQ53DRAFT_750516 [Thozetella sp. PMI_491]|nr:hypothetical protein GQ53DRAFT_750516 [Thozetella sp. PMI_491]